MIAAPWTEGREGKFPRQTPHHSLTDKGGTFPLACNSAAPSRGGPVFPPSLLCPVSPQAGVSGPDGTYAPLFPERCGNFLSRSQAFLDPRQEKEPILPLLEGHGQKTVRRQQQILGGHPPIRQEGMIQKRGRPACNAGRPLLNIHRQSGDYLMKVIVKGI